MAANDANQGLVLTNTDFSAVVNALVFRRTNQAVPLPEGRPFVLAKWQNAQELTQACYDAYTKLGKPDGRSQALLGYIAVGDVTTVETRDRVKQLISGAALTQADQKAAAAGNIFAQEFQYSTTMGAALAAACTSSKGILGNKVNGASCNFGPQSVPDMRSSDAGKTRQ